MKAEESAAEVKAQGTIEEHKRRLVVIKRRFGRTLIWRDCRTPRSASCGVGSGSCAMLSRRLMPNGPWNNASPLTYFRRDSACAFDAFLVCFPWSPPFPSLLLLALVCSFFLSRRLPNLVLCIPNIALS